MNNMNQDRAPLDFDQLPLLADRPFNWDLPREPGMALLEHWIKAQAMILGFRDGTPKSRRPAGSP
jgi:hypothetical protein